MSGPLVVFAFFVACFAIVGVRLFWLQVVDADDLSSAAVAHRTNVISLSAKRGTIYDRNGNVLAMSVDCKTIYCNPKEVTDAEAVAEILAADVGGDESAYLTNLTQDTTFVYLKRKADTSVAEKVQQDLEAAGLSGVYYLSDTKRVYPYGSVAGQILGVVGTDGHGLTGLELEYDSVLSGTDGEMILEEGSDGTPIAGGVSEVTEAQDGTDIVLSIDVNIQQTAEEKIAQAVTDYSADSGSVMVTDPTTGEILAACSTPLANLSDSSSLTNDALKLRLVSDSYEPGSVFKILTMAIGIDAGLINPDTTFTVPAEVKVGDDYVHDDDQRDYTLSMTCREIMRRSSNTGAVLVGEAIGADAFSAGIAAFGIGTATGIDYPGEVSGLVTQRSSYTGATLGAMSFGQGIAIPMDQIVRAVDAIAADGTLTTPHFLVSKGNEKVDWSSTGTACSATAANEVTDMMRTVVQEGTATAAQVEGYDIAGKTGTGEQTRTDSSGYAEYDYMSSLVGFANADDPEVLVYVGLNGTSYLASASAAPVFSAIMSEALTDMGVQPAS